MKKVIIALSLIIFASSCKKDTPEANQPSGEVSTFTELQVPNNFKFETDQKVQLDLSVTNSGFNKKFKIKIYDQMPAVGGNLIYSGFTTNNSLQGEFSCPAYLSRVYVVKEDPTGSSTYQLADITAGSIVHSFGKKSNKSKTNSISPDCSSGCDVSYSNHSGNITINSNDPAGVYCFSGSFNGSINVNKGGVTIRICGNAVAQNINLNSGSGLELTDGATLDVNNLNINSNTGLITVYNATLNISNNFSPSGEVINNGIINVAKAYNINGQGKLTNNGDIDITDHFNNNKDLINNGSIVVGKNCNINGGSSTVNNCSLIVGQDLKISNPVENNGLIDVTDDFTLNSSTLTLQNGAMVNASSATINSNITGVGTTSLVKVSGNTTINGGGSLNGNLEYCDADGIENNTGSINSPASLACAVYIPTTGCNSIGNGSPQVTDTDNDGIADANDLFPNDPDRAGEVYYPGSNVYGTVAFEDLWPGLGDYDFNDLIVDYRIRLITDASNDVKDVEYSYSVRAIGGSLRNGFGFQLDLASNTVQSVTGTQNFHNSLSYNANGTESGQTKAVIIAFDDAFGLFPNTGTQTINTITGETAYPNDTGDIVVTFTSGQSIASLGSLPFNPFMYIGQDRGKEVHLSGKEPTDLVNTSFFGTAEDDSNPGSDRYYVNENNLPWALNLSQSFNYPSEKKDIVQTYNNFVSWAQSSGSSSANWYLDLPGYINQANIY
tara:strand:+ start:5873 stop:8041 length:2169 start_codon:yes stop_codon:yes gene_type:complete